MIEDIKQLIADIETLRDGHKMDASMIHAVGALDIHLRIKNMHEAKAAAYDFVIRKMKRKFKL